MSIPRLSIARPVAMAMFFIAISFLGSISLTRLPVDLLPDIAYPRIVVYTSHPQVAPAEVERFVTQRIEGALAQVPGKIGMESVTREGVSLVTLRFAWGTDMDFATLNVRERLDGVRDELPQEAERPVVLRTDPRSEPIMAISASSDQTMIVALKELAESVFRRRLEQIDGVAHAAVTGGLDRQIQVDVDPRKLESYGLSIERIATAIENANAPSGGGGTVMQGQYQYNLRTLGELQAVDEINDVVIMQPATGQDSVQGRMLVREVATVTDGFRDRESIARYNGQEAIGLLVFKESGANTVRVAEIVDEVLEQLRSEYPEVTLRVAMSQAGFVSGAISNLVQQMILGAGLAFLVLLLFLRDPRYPVAISLAIPISVLSTFALLHAFGVSINIMSLGGLALGVGMLVDNSIVVIENIFRHKEKGLIGAAGAALGAEEVQRAITAATLTTVAVFGPIVYVEGVAGELFKALSFSVAFSLLASLVVAVALLPTLAARWGGEATGKAGAPASEDAAPGTFGRIIRAPAIWFDRVWARVADWYEDALASALEHRFRVVFGALLLLGLTIPFALDLPRSVLPNVDEGEFRVRLELPLGTTLAATAAATTRLEELVRQDEAVDAVFSRIGKQIAIAGVGDQESGLHTATLEVKLHEGEKTAPVLQTLRPKLREFPAGSISIETGHATALGKLLGAGEADLAVRIRGDDLDRALPYAVELEGKLAADPRLANVRVGMELGQPEIEATVDHERAAVQGLTANQVASFLANHMRGTEATQFVAFDRKIPVIVRLPDEQRRSLATIRQLKIEGIPLEKLVSTEERLGAIEIRRRDQNRIVPVYADVAGGGIDEGVNIVREILVRNPPPTDLRVEVGGENEEMERSFRDLTLAFALALLLVYMILAAEFESFIHPFTVLLSVPLGLIGAIFALWLMGAGLNTVSIIGMVILIGIVDNDAVVKIDFINQLRREGKGLREAIREAGAHRLRPIVMNSITTMLGITPMMIGLGPGAGLQAPLAIAVFGGLFTSTILTLLVIPVVYELVDDARSWIARRAGRTAAAPGAIPTFETPRGGSPEPATGD